MLRNSEFLSFYGLMFTLRGSKITVYDAIYQILVLGFFSMNSDLNNGLTSLGTLKANCSKNSQLLHKIEGCIASTPSYLLLNILISKPCLMESRDPEH